MADERNVVFTEREISASARHERKADAKGESAVKWGDLPERKERRQWRMKNGVERTLKREEAKRKFAEHEVNASARPQRNIDAKHESIAKWGGIPERIERCLSVMERQESSLNEKSASVRFPEITSIP